MSYFHFAIPRNATLASRENALQHIAKTYDIKGKVELVRVEPTFRLYRIEYKSA